MAVELKGDVGELLLRVVIGPMKFFPNRTAVDQIRLLCYGFGASVGYYTDQVRILLAAAGVATLLAVVGGLVMLSRIEARRRA